MTHIVLPSGLSGEIRGLKGREIQAMADPALARGGRNLQLMLEGCFLGVDDPGIYKLAKGEMPRWLDVLLGDRFALIVAIRIESWGPEHEFRVGCQNRGCGETFEWELDLRELPRRDLPAAVRQHFLDGGRNLFQCEGPAGEEVSYKLLTGADEVAIEKGRRQNGGRWGIVDALSAQIQSVRVDGSTLLETYMKVRGWLGELDLRPLDEIQATMQAGDCGIDTDIDVQCTFCRMEQTIQLPFDRTFYSPRRKKTGTSQPQT